MFEQNSIWSNVDSSLFGTGSTSVNSGGFDLSGTVNDFGSLVSDLSSLQASANSFLGIFQGLANMINCWGSSSTPSEAQSWVKNKLLPFYQIEATKIQSSNSDIDLSLRFTELSKQLASVREHQLFHKSESNTKCGRDGNQIKADGVGVLLQKLDAASVQLQQNFDVKKSTVQINAVIDFPNNSGISENWKGKSNRPTTATVYEFKRVSTVLGITNPFSGGGSQSLAGGLLFGLLALALPLNNMYQNYKNKKPIFQNLLRIS